MLKLLLAIGGGTTLAILAIVTTLVVGLRRKWLPVLDAVRRLNRRVFNPKQLRSGGREGSYASVIRHVGRVSGTAYATPVVAFDTRDGFVVTLPYGTRPDWVKNVMAGGSATLAHDGRIHLVDRPEVMPIDAVDIHFSAKEQRSHRFYGTDQCLKVRRIGSNLDSTPTDRISVA